MCGSTASTRPGNVVVFHVPAIGSGSSPPRLDVGLVMSVWKGVKKPHVVGSEVPVNSCVAFRCVCLSLADLKDHSFERFTCCIFF